MSYFPRPGETLEEEESRAPGSRFGGLGGRLARAIGSLDKGQIEPPALVEDTYGDTEAFDMPVDEEDEPRFPVGAFGYSRVAVDTYLAEVERELDELRSREPAPPPSINEELARLGEQTASILVTAHDQASQTTRRAEARAQQTLAEASEQARQMIADAESRLRQLDTETDAVWQERRRLIEDVRVTARSLLSLAADAIERFPEEEQPALSGATPEAATPWPAPAQWPPPAQ